MKYRDEKIIELIEKACGIISPSGSINGFSSSTIYRYRELLIEGVDFKKYQDKIELISRKKIHDIINESIKSVKNSNSPQKLKIYNKTRD